LIGGKRVSVAISYVVTRSRGGYGFALASHDPSYPVVIDPGLGFSTFVGGAGTEAGNAIAVDRKGNAYVTGTTMSPDFPTTPGAFDTTYNGGLGDVFVAKLNATGNGLVYSTFLGGAGNDVGEGIVLDRAGRAYIAGRTDSADFPTTAGAFDTTQNGGSDVFVAKLNRAGDALAYSTFVGGAGQDRGLDISADPAGNAYITGSAGPGNFPTTPGAFDTTYNGGLSDVFVAKLNATGSALVYSTFLGGFGGEFGEGLAVDEAGQAYVAGLTDSTDFPTTRGAFDRTYNGGGSEAFVTKLNATGSALPYSTFLGGAVYDEGFGLALDPVGNAHVTGFTGSADFPATAGAFDTTYNGGLDVFVSVLNAAGSALLYSTFLGGTGSESANAIVLDRSGNTYVTGGTGSADFPATAGAFDTTYNGGYDVFVSVLNAVGSALVYSTFLGGVDRDEGVGIALGRTGNAYVTGSTSSPKFPTTAGAFDRTLGGGSDAFVTMLPIGATSG
jgi:hypothetical protein